MTNTNTKTAAKKAIAKPSDVARIKRQLAMPVWNDMKGDAFIWNFEVEWAQLLGQAEAAFHKHDLEIARAKRHWAIMPQKRRR